MSSQASSYFELAPGSYPLKRKPRESSTIIKYKDDEKDKIKAYQLIDDYLKRYPLALYRPRFMRQMDGSQAHLEYVWPVPRVERTQEFRLHHTSSRAVRVTELWSFAEWKARQRTGRSGRE